ncbi:MAG: hypothetical protein ACSHX3_00785 [Litorimonas sp.]
MRLLILGVSALALSACSVGGVGYGTGHYAGYDTNPSVSYGSWQSGQAAGYGQTGLFEYAQTSCSAQTAPPAQGYACALPAPQPPVAPCYQPIQTPCHAAQPHTVNYGYQAPVTPPALYPTGYPAQPIHSPQQPVAPACGHTPCTNSYSVSPYGYGAEYHSASYGVQSPDPYMYGSQAGSSGGYGYQSGIPTRAGHFYGTLGAVWYDIDRPYAGLQGRLGYQSASIIGAEIEGSIGVINEVSPFNQDLGGGVILSGKFKDGVDYSAAAFATASIPLSRNISTHARLGYHSTRTFADVDFDNNPDQEATTTLDGVAYGAGIQMDITPVDAIRADFTRYEGDTDDNDSVSLAYLRRF